MKPISAEDTPDHGEVETLAINSGATIGFHGLSCCAGHTAARRLMIVAVHLLEVLWQFVTAGLEEADEIKHLTLC